MSDYIVKDTELTSVANAIRIKGGTNSQLVFPGEFVSAIGNISGGGGSSDFSTAEVIVSISGNIGYPIILPLLLDGDFSALVASAIYESGTYTVAMYKGTSGGSLDPRILEDFSVNTSGDISYDESEGLITITGDCTITISQR